MSEARFIGIKINGLVKYMKIINNNGGCQFKVLLLKVEMTLIAFIYQRDGKKESR